MSNGTLRRSRALSDWPAHLSSPSGSLEGGNEPSCRAISAEPNAVRPIPPREAGGLSHEPVRLENVLRVENSGGAAPCARSRAKRGAAGAAALPCQHSNNYPNSPYRIRKTAVTYRGTPGAACEVTARVLSDGSGLDRDGRHWVVCDDGKTWEQLGAQLNGAEAKRAFALRQNLEAFFNFYGREHSAFFTLSPLPGTTPRELARRFNDARKHGLPWMRSYGHTIAPNGASNWLAVGE